MIDDRDEPSWTTLEILAVGRVFRGQDDVYRIVLNLSSTFYFVSLGTLEEGGVVPEVGLKVEAELCGSEVGKIRNLSTSPPKVVPSPAAGKPMSEVPTLASH